MLDGSKQCHRPERLKDYDYTSPVGPDPLGRPFPLPAESSQSTDASQTAICQQEIICKLTPAGQVLQALIERIGDVYKNASVDCYVIMPDHVHVLIWLKRPSFESLEVTERNGLPRGSGPTFASLSQIVNALKSMPRRQIGYPLWQAHYYDHIIRNQEDLQNTRQYIQNNPLKWVLDKE